MEELVLATQESEDLLDVCVRLSPQVQQQLTSVPVQHVYTNQVQYVEGGDTNYTTSTMLEWNFIIVLWHIRPEL